MDPEREHPSHRLAMKAWAKGDHESARKLFGECIAQAARDDDPMWQAFYLSGFAKMEAELGNREAFDSLHQRAIGLDPNAPFWRLVHARELWTEFKDADASARQIAEVEALLASKQWEKSGDLSARAYQQKIETLRAWMRGEPGGPLWP